MDKDNYFVSRDSRIEAEERRRFALEKAFTVISIIDSNPSSVFMVDELLAISKRFESYIETGKTDSPK